YGSRMPTLGRVPDCCARATNGQAVTEPIALINSRRLIEPPGLRTGHRINPHLNGQSKSPLWSKADICAAKSDVRSSPESGHVRCNQGCPLWARSGHRDLLDHFVRTG